MAPENWQKIKDIVGEALECAPDERAAFLDAACAQDAGLRKEVDSLLAVHSDAAALSQDLWATAAGDEQQELASIGPYRLLKVLGTGGMGQVWLAEQTEPVRRRVALKLIRAGMYDSSVVKRFQSERQSLAMMDHPAIAKVFDAGATPAGQPYLVMEFVDGLPITDYCDKKKLGIRERLRLFIQVCEGVQHAHQKAIIHRDLKPSNILVVEVDGKPQPRIIDFGLAKAAVPAIAGETLFTHVGGFLGTPGYISPEQADPDVHDIDTRTDVYSLGVVLYELLTGCLPFDTSRWKKQRLDEVLRELRESDPPRPSTKVGSNRDTSTASAEARSTEPRQLVGLLRGDLDWITLKALEKERERRYGTPSQLAGDLERYLENRPVEARPASAGYRLRKYVRRNRIAVAVVASAAAILIAVALMQAVELRRITRERDRADRITEFMSDMFKVSDPSEARGNTVTAREILDKSAQKIDSGLTSDPDLQAQMMHTMGTVYDNLGLYRDAELLFSRAVDVRRRVLGRSNRETLESASNLAWVLREESHFQEAEHLIRETLDLQYRAFGAEDRDTLKSATTLAFILNEDGKYPDAEKLNRETLEIASRVYGPQDDLASLARHYLARDLYYEGKYAEAEKFFRQYYEDGRQKLGDDDPSVLGAQDGVATVLMLLDRYPEAESVFRDCLARKVRVLGSEHPRTLSTAGNLAMLLGYEKHYPEAEQLFRDVLAAKVRALGPDHHLTLLTKGNLAELLGFEGKTVEAERLARETLESERRILGSDHSDTLTTRYVLAAILAHEKRYPEAEKEYRTTLDARRRVLGDDHKHVASTAYDLACVQALEGKRKEALGSLEFAFAHKLNSETLSGLEKDETLRSLHGDPRFDALVAKVHQLRSDVPK